MVPDSSPGSLSTQGLVFCLIWPPAHLFCALVTYKKPPPQPASAPDTPWGLLTKLLALRILQCCAVCP